MEHHGDILGAESCHLLQIQMEMQVRKRWVFVLYHLRISERLECVVIVVGILFLAEVVA